MNYIQQINLFEQWAELHMPSTGQYALYYALLALNNRSGWKEWFNAPNSVIADKIGMTPQGIRKARTALVDSHLIDIKIVGSNKATLYKIHELTSEIVSANYSTSGIVTATVSAQEGLPLEKFPQQFPVLKQETITKQETTATTTAEVHKKVFNTLMMNGLMSNYIMTLKDKGFTDTFIQELMLETGEAGSKPSLRLMQAIGERWIAEGIYTRLEAKKRKTANGSSSVGKTGQAAKHNLPKADIDEFPERKELSPDEWTKMFM